MSSKKIVLVTGASTGLGYQIVKALYASATPYSILLGGRSLAKAEDAIQRLKNESATGQGDVRAIQIDIEDDVSIASAFKEIEGKYGKLDALVNNAGELIITFYYGSIEQSSDPC